MASPIAVFAAAELDQHITPPWHPERPARIDAVVAGVAEAGLIDATHFHRPRRASVAELTLVHDDTYVRTLEEFCASGGGDLDADTSASPGSWETSLRSVGGVLDAIDALRRDECDLAFAAGRPPGHHALADRAMGFCLFNNVAVGAASLVADGHRVAIVDWDVHHGNGTQDIFYDEANVLYISTHESPLYPGTGKVAETGGPNAIGTTLNLPFPAGTRGDVLRRAFDEVITPVVEQFRPDWLLISAGFDAHRRDPLAGLELTSADFADLGERLQRLVPPRRTVLVLEGGYDDAALTMSTGATLAAMIGESYRPEEASTGDVGAPTVVAAAQRLFGS